MSAEDPVTPEDIGIAWATGEWLRIRKRSMWKVSYKQSSVSGATVIGLLSNEALKTRLESMPGSPWLFELAEIAEFTGRDGTGPMVFGTGRLDNFMASLETVDSGIGVALAKLSDAEFLGLVHGLIPMMPVAAPPPVLG